MLRGQLQDLDELVYMKQNYIFVRVKYYLNRKTMNNSLQDHAVLNLLHLCDEDSIIFNQIHTNPQYNILTEKEPSNKSNTIFITNRLTHTNKIKTQMSPEHTVTSTQNKENLKKILQKLRDSPVHTKKKITKKKEVQSKHVKTQPQSRLKLFKKTPDKIERPFLRKVQISQKDREKELMNALVKAKIIEKLKLMEQQKTNRQFRQQSFRISTVRDIQGIRKGQASLQTNKREQISLQGRRQLNSRLNLIKGSPSTNKNTLLNGKCSHVNLKHLLF